MDVVRHQAVGPALNIRPAHMIAQGLPIKVLAAVLEDNRPALIAERGDVVRESGIDDTGEPNHGRDIARPERTGNIDPVPGFLVVERS